MSSVLTPDLCIIGDSAGGLRAALMAAAFGVPTILIRTGATDEKRMMQAATFAATSNLAHRIKNAAHYGLRTNLAELDWTAFLARVAADTKIITTRFSNTRFAALGIRVIEAEPHFESTQVLRAGEYQIAARRFILALDTAPAHIDTDQTDMAALIAPETLEQLTSLPQSLAVIGGDADALTFAQSFARLGVTTSLIAPEGLLPGEDAEQVAIIVTALRRDGVAVHEDRPITTLVKKDDGARIALGGSEQTHILEADVVLNCTRVPAGLDRLGLAMAGISSGATGITVDPHLRTSNRAVFAVGPCAAVGRPGQGVAAARAQAELAMRQILFRFPSAYDANNIPRVAGTDPDFAAVGLTEAEARAQYGAISVLRSPFAENDLAIASGEAQGHVKALLDRRGRLLGASVTGPAARELIGPWAAALGEKPKALRQSIAPAPSFAETPRRALMEAYAPLARSKTVRTISAFLRRIG